MMSKFCSHITFSSRKTDKKRTNKSVKIVINSIEDTKEANINGIGNA